MTGTISKDHKFCTIIKKEDLKSLHDFICKEYEYVECSISTKNGAKFELITFDDIISYDNIEFKKIIQIYIKAQKEKPLINIFPDFEISLADLNHYSTSISYCIRKATEKEIEYRTQKIEELINNFKANYSWLYKNSNGLIFFLFIWCSILIPLQLYLKGKVETITLYVTVWTLAFIIGWIFSRLFNEIISFFFPQNVFCIGKQVDFYDRKKTLRQNWLWGIIVTFFVSLISSILVFFITN